MHNADCMQVSTDGSSTSPADIPMHVVDAWYGTHVTCTPSRLLTATWLCVAPGHAWSTQVRGYILHAHVDVNGVVQVQGL